MVVYASRFFYLATCLLVFALPPLDAEIRVVHDIAALEQEVTPTTLVLLDIDHTLIHPTISLGGVKWWDHLRKAMATRDVNQEAVRAFCYPILGWLTQHIPSLPMQSETASVLKRLQERGITLLGLTARWKKAPFCVHYDRVTRDELLQHDMDLTRSPLPPGLSFDEIDRELYAFSYGILFSNHFKKGTSLQAFLKDKNWKPERVILVDDRIEQLRSVEAAMAEEGIPFLGLNYRPNAFEEDPFDIGVSNVQLHALLTTGSIPSEGEAIRIKRQYPGRPADFCLDHLIQQVRVMTEAMHRQ